MKENLIDIEPEELVKGEKKLPPEDLARDLVPSDDLILRTELDEFDFKNPPVSPEYIAHVLAHSIIRYNGLGLACNQIGLPYRAFIVTGNPMLCMFNPRIVGESEEEVYLEEGCLTFPDLFIKIKRPEVVRVRFTMPMDKWTHAIFKVLLRAVSNMN